MRAVLGKALQEAIRHTATEFELADDLLIAWSCAVTYWDASTAHYDPNFDRMRIAGKPEVWSQHPDWVVDGPTCEEFFVFHPQRQDEWRDDRNYEFVAQTRLASSYGPFLLPYPTAFRHGFTGDPEDLASVDDGTYWAAVALRAEIAEAEAIGRHGQEALAFALMTVGSLIPSRHRVEALETAHREIYGAGFFMA